MSAHERGHDVQRRLVAEAGDHAQHFQFLGGVQSVTAFHFHGRGAEVQRRERVLARGFEQLVLAGRLDGSDAGKDAAARAENFQIRFALQAHREFLLAPRRKADVRVRIDEAGDHRRTVAVAFFLDLRVLRGESRAHFRLVADGGDQAVFDEQRALFPRRDAPLIGPRRRRVARQRRGDRRVVKQFPAHLSASF